MPPNQATNNAAIVIQRLLTTLYRNFVEARDGILEEHSYAACCLAYFNSSVGLHRDGVACLDGCEKILAKQVNADYRFVLPDVGHNNA